MAASRNISVSEVSRPKLPRHARLKFDETRQVWVILAPERVLAPDGMLQDLADKGFLTEAREKTS
jgi:pyrroloquinoline quinone biosynthesis protein D